MPHRIIGKGQIARPRTTGAGAPAGDTSEHRVAGRSQIARPCPDGPSMPAGDLTGHRIVGRAPWRKPCVGAGCSCCPNCLLDNFNRTETSDWGDATAGYTWTMEASGTFGVEDGVAFVEGGYAYGMVEGPGPWDAEFTLNTRVRAATAITPGTLAFFEFQTVDDVTFYNRYIDIEFDETGDCEIRLLTPLGETSEFITIDPAEWLNIKWHYRPGDVLEAKAWQGAEPDDWTVSRPDDGAAPTTNQHNHWAAADTEGGSERLEIDFISFVSCISDDFERTVVDDWGGSWTRVAGSPGAFAVDGSAGLFNPELSQTPIPDADDGAMLLVRQFPAGVVEFCASFSVRDTTTHDDDESDVFFYLADSVASTPSIRGIEFFVRSDSETPPFIGPPYILSLSVRGRGTDHGGDVGDITFNPASFHFGDVYHVHGRIEGGRALGRIWKDGQAEPDDWQIQGGDEGYTTTLADSFFIGPANVGQTFALHDICAQPDCITEDFGDEG